MTPTWASDDGRVSLYCANCLEVLPTIERGSVDAVVTDPPYEVGFADWDKWNSDWLNETKIISPIVAFTCGIVNVSRYPSPTWILCWAKPGSTRRNITGGFNHWEPVLLYGKKRIWVDYIYLPDCINHVSSDIDHPCPKPVSLMSWLVKITSERDCLILDPFMGSGTTLVAAKNLGRRAIGIEIEERYCEIAVERLAQAVLPLEARAT